MFPKLTALIGLDKDALAAALGAMSEADLRELRREVRLQSRTALTAGVTPEVRAEITEALRITDVMGAVADDKAAAEKIVDDPEPEPKAAAEDPEPDDGDGDDGAEPDPDAGAEAKVPALAAAGAAKPTKRFGQAGTQKKGVPIGASMVQASENVPGHKAGDSFGSWHELAEALAAKSVVIEGNSNQKFQVGSIRGDYSEARTLGLDPFENIKKFEAVTGMDADAEVMAAFCAPATPYYGISCRTTDRRPVAASLPSFAAPRMQVSIMPSPTLADMGDGLVGWGQWEDTDDDDPTARKNCITITCGSPTTYKAYGIWRCITIKNLLAMSYPELVEAWLNRLASAQARFAEQLLLNAMGAGATTVHTAALGYSGTVSILSLILTYLGLYQESSRWDLSGNMEAWLPRWVLYAIKTDLFRRRQVGSSVPSVASDAQVNALFSDAGVNVHWFIDTPSWAVAVPAIHSGNVLNLFPATVQILVAPPGKFAMIDRGDLSIGVTGNNIYRDNSSNAQNQFTMFFESFEGIVNTNTCPAHLLDIPVCWSGVQIDDIVINCQGGDEAGYQS